MLVLVLVFFFMLVGGRGGWGVWGWVPRRSAMVVLGVFGGVYWLGCAVGGLVDGAAVFWLVGVGWGRGGMLAEGGWGGGCVHAHGLIY